MTYERQSRQGSNRGLRAFGEQAQPGIDACLFAFGAGVQWPSSPASVTMARHSYFSDGATIPRWKSPPFFLFTIILANNTCSFGAQAPCFSTSQKKS